MQVEKRALYNSIRMNWFYDQSVKVENWQVEDYRKIAIEQLFERLLSYKFHLDKNSFGALADHADSPEEFAEQLVADSELSAEEQDQVYLILFELWRRLLPERLSLSVFCDELDHRIFLYDSGQLANPESIADILANLKVILDENVDDGVPPQEAFQSLSTGCANDLESFIYDFISEQLDNDNDLYAAELVESFYEYMSDLKWFDFLKVRILSNTDFEGSLNVLNELIQNKKYQHDLELGFEMLSFLVQSEDKKLFSQIVKKTIPLIETEDDFQDILSLCIDFFRNYEDEKSENQLQKILNKRSKYRLQAKFSSSDLDRKEFLKITN